MGGTLEKQTLEQNNDNPGIYQNLIIKIRKIKIIQLKNNQQNH